MTAILAPRQGSVQARAKQVWKFHPLTEVFPPLPHADMQTLAADIRRAGTSAPILVAGDEIIDDRNRALACQIAGIAVEFCQWDGCESIAELVGRHNVPRSHLTESQRAAVAVPIAEQISIESRFGRTRGLKRGKTAFPANPPVSLKLGSRRNSERETPEEEAGGYEKASQRAADICHVSRAYVEFAQQIYRKDKALFHLVRLGERNLSEARNQLSKQKRREKLSIDLPPAKRAKSDEIVMIGDCLKIMTTLPRRKFSLIFADPPYNNGSKYDADPTKDRLPETDYLAWSEKWMRECNELLAPDGSFYILIDGHHVCDLGVKLKNFGLHLRNVVVWRDHFPNYNRENFSPSARFLLYCTRGRKVFVWNPDAILEKSAREILGDKRRVQEGTVPFNVWNFPVVGADGKPLEEIVPFNIWNFSRVVGNAIDRVPFDDAPPQLPNALLRRVILVSSNPGDTVFDPFCGNGTTARTAIELGRNALTIERSPKYAEQARQWIGSSIKDGDLGGKRPSAIPGGGK